MAIPTYDKLMRPILELAVQQPINRRTATDAMVSQHALTPEDLAQKLSGGDSTIKNRTGWAMTFLTKAGLIAKIAPKTYQATDLGRSFLAKHKGAIREVDLKTIPGYEEAWAAGAAKRRQKESLAADKTDPALSNETATPHEIIAREVSSLDADLRGRLLQTIV